MSSHEKLNNSITQTELGSDVYLTLIRSCIKSFFEAALNKPALLTKIRPQLFGALALNGCMVMPDDIRMTDPIITNGSNTTRPSGTSSSEGTDTSLRTTGEVSTTTDPAVTMGNVTEVAFTTGEMGSTTVDITGTSITTGVGVGCENDADCNSKGFCGVDDMVCHCNEGYAGDNCKQCDQGYLNTAPIPPGVICELNPSVPGQFIFNNVPAAIPPIFVIDGTTPDPGKTYFAFYKYSCDKMVIFEPMPTYIANSSTWEVTVEAMLPDDQYPADCKLTVFGANQANEPGPVAEKIVTVFK